MTNPAVFGGDALASEGPPFPVAPVEEVLRQLDKTVRARQLYRENNPTYLRAIDALRAAFEALWALTPSITLEVTAADFRWHGRVVHQQAEKATDSLPWLCYKDGIREITWHHGVEQREIERFIELVPLVRRASAGDLDLVSLLWELELTAFEYRFVDAGHDGVSLPEAADAPGRLNDAGVSAAQIDEDVHASSEGESGGEPAARPAGVVSMDDFDSTLYFLDEAEATYIRTELEAEYASDRRRIVVDALFDIFELQADEAVRREVVDLLGQLLLHLLAAAEFTTVAYLLREIRTVSERARELSPDSRASLEALGVRLSAPETLRQLLLQLDDTRDRPAGDDLSILFAELQPTALETVLSSLSSVRDARLRELLATAAERLASANTTELVRLIASSDRVVSVEAMRRAGGMRTAAAVAPLARMLSDPDREIRVVAVQALIEIGSPGSLQMLDRALTDADRDVRVQAVRALAARGQRAALVRVEAIVRGKEIRSADLGERMAFFEAYGALCGDTGVTFLDSLLNGRSGFMGRREDPELRACAALALGRIATPKSRESLERAVAEKDAVVRSAVTKALRGVTP
jgi:HEAT repeat protein